jgi:hypothetical protein
MSGPDHMSAAEYQEFIRQGGSAARSTSRKGEKTQSWHEFDQWLQTIGVEVVREHRFHPDRMWRFDWFVVGRKVAFEYDGLFAGRDRDQGTASHASVAGILRDAEKINAAQELGIRVFRVNAKTIQDGSAFELAWRVLSRQDG